MIFLCFLYLQSEMTVHSVSAETVFVQLNQTSLSEGDELEVFDQTKAISILRVNQVSSKTASCSLIDGPMPKAGMICKIKQKKESKALPQNIIPERAEKSKVTYQKSAPQKRDLLKGKVAFLFHNFSPDEGQSQSTPTLKFSIREGKSFRSGYQFRFKTRSRDYEETPFRIRNDSDGWQHRIYEANVTRESEGQLFSWSLGRVFAYEAPSIGAVDGARLTFHPNQKSGLSVFAGFSPKWQYQDLESEKQHIAMAYKWQQNPQDGKGWQITSSLVGSYDDGEVSREFVLLKTTFSNHRFRFYESLEYDFHRDWRKDQSGESGQISNLFLRGDWNLGSSWNLGIQYDNRKPILTHPLTEEEQLVDRLFRQGYRVTSSWRWAKGHMLWLNLGLLDREGSEETNSYVMRYRMAQLFQKNVSLQAKLAGYDQGLTEGFQWGVESSIQLTKHQITVGYDQSEYDLLGFTGRENNWFHLGWFSHFSRSFYGQVMGEWHDGDEAPGLRSFVTLGYRF